MEPVSFDRRRIALGYASDRPYLHPAVIRKSRMDNQIDAPFPRGLDIGCGAGLSTRALKDLCREVTGIDSSAEMIRMCEALYPQEGYLFRQCSAEQIDLPADSCQIATAAGVVNWVEEAPFLTALKRVLTNQGLLCVYDFWITEEMPGCPRYRDWWYGQYLPRFPKPPRKENRWTKETLIDGYSMEGQYGLKLSWDFTLDAFIRFMMIQSNVNRQIENGQSPEEIRAWFQNSLSSLWTDDTKKGLPAKAANASPASAKRTLVFDGYVWYIRLRK